MSVDGRAAGRVWHRSFLINIHRPIVPREHRSLLPKAASGSWARGNAKAWGPWHTGTWLTQHNRCPAENPDSPRHWSARLDNHHDLSGLYCVGRPDRSSSRISIGSRSFRPCPPNVITKGSIMYVHDLSAAIERLDANDMCLLGEVHRWNPLWLTQKGQMASGVNELGEACSSHQCLWYHHAQTLYTRRQWTLITIQIWTRKIHPDWYALVMSRSLLS